MLRIARRSARALPLALTAVTLACAAFAMPAHATSVDALMEAAELQRVSEEAARGLVRSITDELETSAGQFGLDAAQVERMTATAERIYTADALFESLRETMADGLDDAERTALVEHMHSPLGRRATALERDRSPGEQPEALNAFIMGYDHDETGLHRLGLLSALTDALKLPDAMTDIAVATQLAVATAVVGDDPQAIAYLRDQLESQRPLILAQMKQTLPLMYGYTYEPLSVAELEAMVAEVRNPHSLRMGDAMVDGLKGWMVRSSYEFGLRLREQTEQAGQFAEI